MENNQIKKRNSDNITNKNSNLKDDSTSINPELGGSVIIPNNITELTRNIYQNNRDALEIKQQKILKFNNLDAKIKHKKLREGD